MKSLQENTQSSHTEVVNTTSASIKGLFKDANMFIMGTVTMHILQKMLIIIK